MLANTQRFHNIWFQENDFLKILKILSKSSRRSTFSARIQNLGWTHLKSTSKIIVIDVENSSFVYDLTIESLVKRSLVHSCSRTLRFLKLVHWRRVLRTMFGPSAQPDLSLGINLRMYQDTTTCKAAARETRGILSKHRREVVPSELGCRTWSGHSWNLRRKSL